LAERHYALLELFGNLVSKFSICKYNSIDELKSFTDQKEISHIIAKIDKAFLILFSYHESKDSNVIYSYAIDENNNRFKIAKENSTLKITKEKVNKEELGELLIVSDETNFAETYLISKLMDLADLFLAGEKSDYIKKIDRF